MDDLNESQNAESPHLGEGGDAQLKAAKAKPTKTLPTDRLTFDKQLSIVRAYAAASGLEKQATSNADVAKIAGISSSSISITNPFLMDVGLLVREGMKQRPTQAVFDYAAACEWNKETAGQKLAPALSGAWFAKALLPRLSFRSLTIDEAVSVLADEAKAPKDCKDQLALILDYLAAAGLILREGNTVSKINGNRDHGGFDDVDRNKPPRELHEDGAVKRFEIPIPGKSSAVITIPQNIDAEDWAMLTQMMGIYVGRWKGEQFKPQSPAKPKQQDNGEGLV